MGVGNPNQVPLKGQPVLLTSKLSLQPHCLFVCLLIGLSVKRKLFSLARLTVNTSLASALWVPALQVYGPMAGPERQLFNKTIPFPSSASYFLSVGSGSGYTHLNDILLSLCALYTLRSLKSLLKCTLLTQQAIILRPAL